MQSLQSFINRNSFKEDIVINLINELNISLVNAGKVQMLMKDDANTLRREYASRMAAQSK